MKINKYLSSIISKISYGEKELFSISLAFVLTALDIIISWLFHIGSALALPLICVCISPLYLLAFRAGMVYALISTLCSFLLLGVIKGFIYSSVQIALLWLPALVASALILLNRKKPSGSKAYLPLPQLFFSLLLINILVISSILTIILHNPTNVSFLKGLISNQLNYISEANSTLPASMQVHFIEVKKIILDNFLKILTCLISVYNVVFMLSNLYIGLTISKRFKLLSRKSFYWPKDLRLPLAALMLFISGLLALLLKSNIVALYAIIVISTFGVAFFMCGIAYWHDVTRKIPFRILILLFTYIGLLYKDASPALCCTVLLMGLWSTIKHYKIHKYLL